MWNENLPYKNYGYFKSDEDGEQNKETLINYTVLEDALHKLCPELNKSDLFQVTQETAFRMSSIICDDLVVRDIQPEVFYAVCTADFLHDGHSVNELLELDDDGKLFDYCPSIFDERIGRSLEEILINELCMRIKGIAELYRDGKVDDLSYYQGISYGFRVAKNDISATGYPVNIDKLSEKIEKFSKEISDEYDHDLYDDQDFYDGYIRAITITVKETGCNVALMEQKLEQVLSGFWPEKEEEIER